MRKSRMKTFEELVLENKKELLKDEEAINRLEERLERRLLKRLD